MNKCIRSALFWRSGFSGDIDGIEKRGTRETGVFPRFEQASQEMVVRSETLEVVGRIVFDHEGIFVGPDHIGREEDQIHVSGSIVVTFMAPSFRY